MRYAKNLHHAENSASDNSAEHMESLMRIWEIQEIMKKPQEIPGIFQKIFGYFRDFPKKSSGQGGSTGGGTILKKSLSLSAPKVPLFQDFGLGGGVKICLD